MGLIRPAARAALWRWREVIATAAAGLFGLWLMALGGYLLLPLGGLVLGVALALGVLALRRMRFAQGSGAPGVVSVDEGQVAFFGPEAGGFVSLRELVELRLVRVMGQRHWRLKQSDGQALLVPVEAAGAEALFDAFASLPGMDTQGLIAALEAGPADPRGSGGLPALAGTELGPVIWHRPLSVTGR